MPEGHSIHRLAKHFSETFLCVPVRASSPQGRFTSGAAILDGHIPVAAEAYGKHFFLRFDNGMYLNVHLGMYGAWNFGGRIHSSIGAPRKIGEKEVHESSTETMLPEPKSTVRLRLVNSSGWADLIGASICRVLTGPEARDVISSIGPDPLRNDADPQRFFEAASKTRRKIGSVLMDQKLIGGIGNIYRAEGLFRARLNPHTPSNSLGSETLQALWDDQVEIMALGVKYGRIITTEPEHRPGVPIQNAWPEHAHYVYQRQNSACKVCGTRSITVQEMEARKLYWCTTCQV